MRDQLSPSTSSIHDVNELPNSDAVEAESLPERNSSESSNETEMFNVSMERGEDESFVSETTHELLSCVDCSMKQERIENLQKSRSKLKRQNLLLRKENANLQKVCCNEFISTIVYIVRDSLSRAGHKKSK